MQMFCRFRAEFFGAIVATAIPINSYLDYIGVMKQVFVSFLICSFLRDFFCFRGCNFLSFVV